MNFYDSLNWKKNAPPNEEKLHIVYVLNMFADAS